MNNIKMVYYDIIDVSEGIDVNKTSESKECDICHYCYFLDKAFKFQSDFWNGFQGVLIMSMNLSNIAILNIQGVDYRCIISEVYIKMDKQSKRLVLLKLKNTNFTNTYFDKQYRY